MDPSILKAVPVFAEVPEDDLRVVSTFATLEETAAGKTVVRQGDYANHFMAIEEGEARVVRDGDEVGRLGPGDIFGEVGVLEKERRSASVEALTHLRLIKIEHWELQRMKKVLPNVYARIEELAAERSGEGPEAA